MKWWEAVIGIFYQPATVFESMKAKPRWLAPLVVILLASLLVFLIIWKPIIMPEQVEGIMSNERIPAEGKDKALETMSGPMGYVFGLAGILIAQPAVMLLMALVFWGLFAAMGAKSGFGAMFAAVVHGALASLPGSLVKVPLMFIKQTAKVHTSLALILPPEMEDGFLFRLLAQVDVFTIWTLVIMSIGFSVLAGAGRKKSYAAVFSAWAAWALLSAALGGMLKFGAH